ncbi:hypothetical protein EVAR_6588_1 [Eumeta japonica]|uniref:Uncharacterized protein n=1 Tax=Eumeta variegata TaxID=151549 RepID=A0A4C1ST72_EUMVA|nr:hypothetical protein EVAR_6588_1 [Eumeta japonica]
MRLKNNAISVFHTYVQRPHLESTEWVARLVCRDVLYAKHGYYDSQSGDLESELETNFKPTSTSFLAEAPVAQPSCHLTEHAAARASLVVPLSTRVVFTMLKITAGGTWVSKFEKLSQIHLFLESDYKLQ